MDKKNLPHVRVSSIAIPQTIEEAIQYVLRFKLKTTSEKSHKSYKSVYDDLTMWLRLRNFHVTPVRFFDSTLAMAYMDQILLSKLAPKTKNKYIAYLKGMCNMMVDRKWITSNPFANVRPINASRDVPRAFSPAVRDELFITLKDFDVCLYRFAVCIYYLLARPKEIFCIKIGDIDLKNREIKIDRANSKTKMDKRCVIPDPLYHLLLAMKVEMMPSSYYLFAHDLRPGKKRVARFDNNAKRFRRLKDRLKNDHGILMPDNAKMYSLKHTGVRDFLREGIPITEVQRQSGLTLEIIQIYAESQFRRSDDRFLDLAPGLCTEKSLRLSKVDQLVPLIGQLTEQELELLLRKIGR